MFLTISVYYFHAIRSTYTDGNQREIRIRSLSPDLYLAIVHMSNTAYTVPALTIWGHQKSPVHIEELDIVPSSQPLEDGEESLTVQCRQDLHQAGPDVVQSTVCMGFSELFSWPEDALG